MSAKLVKKEGYTVDFEITASPEKFEELVHTFGEDRCLFGTDFPMWDTKAELERFMAVKITDDQREKILYKNAADILKIK